MIKTAAALAGLLMLFLCFVPVDLFPANVSPSLGDGCVSLETLWTSSAFSASLRLKCGPDLYRRDAKNAEDAQRRPRHFIKLSACLYRQGSSVINNGDLNQVSTETQRTLKSHGAGIENSDALRNFFSELTATQSRQRIEPVRIMHFGDSHVAADVLTREIRERFQQEFGDGGPGFLVPRNPMATRRRGVLSGFSEGWVVEGIGGRYSPDAIYGPAGINLATSDPGERAWLETLCNHFEVYLARQPNGGKVEITIDGVDALEEPLILNSRVAKLDSIAIDLPDDAPHRIEVRTLSPGKVRLLGIVAEHLSGGISYDVLGINGAKANRILTWNQQALIAAIRARDPNLIMLAYGTNEVTDGTWTPAAYESLLGEIIQFLHKAAPNASILIFAPPDRVDLPVSARLSSLIDAERRAALANNAAFWSAYDAMGGAGSMTRWVRQGLAQPDRVHLTSAGYAKLADMFYEDLRRAWR